MKLSPCALPLPWPLAATSPCVSVELCVQTLWAVDSCACRLGCLLAPGVLFEAPVWGRVTPRAVHLPSGASHLLAAFGLLPPPGSAVGASMTLPLLKLVPFCQRLTESRLPAGLCCSLGTQTQTQPLSCAPPSHPHPSPPTGLHFHTWKRGESGWALVRPLSRHTQGDRTFQFIPSQVRGRGSTRQQRHRAQVGKCKPRGETGTQRDPRPPGWGGPA